MQRTIWLGATVGWALAVALLTSSDALTRISPWRTATLERVIVVGPPRSRAWRQIEITLSVSQVARVAPRTELTLRVRRLPAGRSPALQGRLEIAPNVAVAPAVVALTLRATDGRVLDAAVGEAAARPFGADSMTSYLAAAGVKAEDGVARRDIDALARLVTGLATTSPLEMRTPVPPMREGLALVLRSESRTESSGLSRTQTILVGVVAAMIGAAPCVWLAVRRRGSRA